MTSIRSLFTLQEPRKGNFFSVSLSAFRKLRKKFPFSSGVGVPGREKSRRSALRQTIA